MRSKLTPEQYERALALMEAQAGLETERRALQEAARASERSEFASWVEGIRVQTAREAVDTRNHIEALERLVLKDSEGTSAYIAHLHEITLSKLTELGEKLDRLYEIVGVPRDATVPTLEEQLQAASTNEAVRKEIQRLVAEAEFENTEVEFFD